MRKSQKHDGSQHRGGDIQKSRTTRYIAKDQGIQHETNLSYYGEDDTVQEYDKDELMCLKSARQEPKVNENNIDIPKVY